MGTALAMVAFLGAFHIQMLATHQAPWYGYRAEENAGWSLTLSTATREGPVQLAENGWKQWIGLL
jgi:hypothetical protein